MEPLLLDDDEFAASILPYEPRFVRPDQFAIDGMAKPDADFLEAIDPHLGDALKSRGLQVTWKHVRNSGEDMGRRVFAHELGEGRYVHDARRVMPLPV
jgi:hypothetical protein